MNSKLEMCFLNVYNSILENIENNFQEGERKGGKIDSLRKLAITKSNLTTTIKTLLYKSPKKNSQEFINCLNSTKLYLPFCSSPKSFKTAWELRTNKLSIKDAEEIAKLGGQFIPENVSSRLFRIEQQGNLYHNKIFMKAVRHSEGNYNDKLDDLGNFTYETPENLSGMLRYRLSELITEKTNIPYVLLVVMWFEYKIEEDIKHIFFLCPAKVTMKKKFDLNNITAPINLQLIERDEAFNILNRFESFNDSDIELKIRDELSKNISREFSYENISNSKKGRAIKLWAKKSGKRCIDGTICNGIEFSELKDSEIAFGHIISQNWAKSFSFLLNNINHPDNLYLTCQKCNSSLGDKFPNSELKNRIYEEGTIGDWLRIGIIK